MIALLKIDFIDFNILIKIRIYNFIKEKKWYLHMFFILSEKNNWIQNFKWHISNKHD